MNSPSRPNLSTTFPDIYARLTAVSAAIGTAFDAAGLSRTLLELVNIRVSQINGCAFCLRMHTRDALTAGEHPERLTVLPAWRETSYFSAQESAALALAEAITQLPGQHVPEAVATEARERLGEAAMALVSWAAISMNAFNRLALTSEYEVSPG